MATVLIRDVGEVRRKKNEKGSLMKDGLKEMLPLYSPREARGRRRWLEPKMAKRQLLTMSD